MIPDFLNPSSGLSCVAAKTISFRLFSSRRIRETELTEIRRAQSITGTFFGRDLTSFGARVKTHGQQNDFFPTDLKSSPRVSHADFVKSNSI